MPLVSVKGDKGTVLVLPAQAWEVTAGGKALLLDVEFEWLGVLEN